MNDASKEMTYDVTLSSDEMNLVMLCRHMNPEHFALIAQLANELHRLEMLDDAVAYQIQSNSHGITQEESLEQARRMSSEDRIGALSHGIIDNDILTVEISHRTGIGEDLVCPVLVYELLHSDESPFGPYGNFEEAAKLIASITEPQEEGTEGIENVDYETALRVLICEDEVYVDCGLAEEI